MPEEQAEKQPRFYADCMLGRLARWLRALGLDTSYDRAIEDDELLERCRLTGRVLLTRDTQLAERASDITVMLVESEKAEDQLRQVMRLFRLTISPGELFSRCTHCNEPVVELPKEEVEGKVPPYVFGTEKRFTYCPNCDKLFWRGTHRKRFLTHILNENESEQAG